MGYDTPSKRLLAKAIHELDQDGELSERTRNRLDEPLPSELYNGIPET